MCISAAHPLSAADSQIERVNHRGWDGSYKIGNGVVQAIVVPAVGRVMQFSFKGETTGPFWENPKLGGAPVQPQGSDWINFGGDKTWPSPQDDWGKVTGRGWPPPQAFDSMSVTASTTAQSIILDSPVDSHFGIKTHREITLRPGKAVMDIVTTYEKVREPAIKTGVWIITQLASPEMVCVPLPAQSKMTNGYIKMSGDLPEAFQVKDGMITLKRGTEKPTKIGTEGSTMVWVGPAHIVRIDSPRLPAAEYPDSGSSAQVYTNPDPLPYVELEMLAPLHTLKVGDKISQTNTYSLYRRTRMETMAQVRSVLTKSPEQTQRATTPEAISCRESARA